VLQPDEEQRITFCNSNFVDQNYLLIVAARNGSITFKNNYLQVLIPHTNDDTTVN
jgi:hypothetical protein